MNKMFKKHANYSSRRNELAYYEMISLYCMQNCAVLHTTENVCLNFFNNNWITGQTRTGYRISLLSGEISVKLATDSRFPTS